MELMKLEGTSKRGRRQHKENMDKQKISKRSVLEIRGHAAA
jgi:hypothetical protein